jgi:hypothetical protein
LQRLGFSWWWLLLATVLFWMLSLRGIGAFIAFVSSWVTASSATEPWSATFGYIGMAIVGFTIAAYGITALNLAVNLFGFSGLSHKYLALGTWIGSVIYPLLQPTALYLSLVTGLISSVVYALLREARTRPRAQRPKRERVTGYICRSCQHRGDRPSSRCSVCGSSNLTQVTSAWAQESRTPRFMKLPLRSSPGFVAPVLLHLFASGAHLALRSAIGDGFEVPLLWIFLRLIELTSPSISF